MFLISLDQNVSNILIYTMGIIALICFASSFQTKKRSVLLILQTISLVLFMGQYLLLGAYTGLILEVVCIVRNFTYYFRNKTKYLNTIVTPLIFIIAAVVVGLFTLDGNWYCVIPVIANILQTIGLDMKSERNNRIFFLLASPLWLVYNVLTNTVFGVVTEIMNIISIIVSIIIITKAMDKEKIKEKHA